MEKIETVELPNGCKFISTEGKDTFDLVWEGETITYPMNTWWRKISFCQTLSSKHLPTYIKCEKKMMEEGFDAFAMGLGGVRTYPPTEE